VREPQAFAADAFPGALAEFAPDCVLCQLHASIMQYIHCPSRALGMTRLNMFMSGSIKEHPLLSRPHPTSLVLRTQTRQ
jgi:hypothetical protein